MAILQGRPRVFAFASVVGIGELLSRSSAQLCSTLRHFVPASASSRAPQLTKLTQLNSRKGILKGISFSPLFFPISQFLGAFCPTVKMLHASHYDSGGLKLARLIQGNGLKNNKANLSLWGFRENVIIWRPIYAYIVWFNTARKF